MSTARQVVLDRIKAANAAAGHPNPVPIPRDGHGRQIGAGSTSCWNCWSTGCDYKATVVESTPSGMRSPRPGRRRGDRPRPRPAGPARCWVSRRCRGRAGVHLVRPRRVCRRGHRIRRDVCADRDDSALDGSPDQGRLHPRWCPKCPCASCRWSPSSRPSPSQSPGWSRPGRRRSSADRRRRAH